MSLRKRTSRWLACAFTAAAVASAAGCEEKTIVVVQPNEGRTESEPPDAAPIPDATSEPADEPESVPQPEALILPVFPEAGSTITPGGVDVPDYREPTVP